MATRTRNRISRLAVLDSSVRRPASTSPTARSRSPLRRRAVVVGLLVLVSLALITVSFRETSDGPLHGVQNAGAAVMKPFEVAADRIARPFRDAYNWFDGLIHDALREPAAEERGARAAPAVRDREVGGERQRRVAAVARLRARPRLPEGLQGRQRDRRRRAPLRTSSRRSASQRDRTRASGSTIPS